MTLRQTRKHHPLDGDTGFNPFGSGPVPIEPRDEDDVPRERKTPEDAGDR